MADGNPLDGAANRNRPTVGPTGSCRPFLRSTGPLRADGGGRADPLLRPRRNMTASKSSRPEAADCARLAEARNEDWQWAGSGTSAPSPGDGVADQRPWLAPRRKPLIRRASRPRSNSPGPGSTMSLHGTRIALGHDFIENTLRSMSNARHFAPTPSSSLHREDGQMVVSTTGPRMPNRRKGAGAEKTLAD